MSIGCWFANTFEDAGPCEERLVKAHLITRSLLKREFPFGAYKSTINPGGMTLALTVDGAYNADGQLHPIRSGTTLHGAIEVRPLDVIMADPRCWVPSCGGPMGNAGHHGQFAPDGPRPVPRHLLPPELEEFAADLNLVWWLERTYGPLEMAA